MSEPDVISVQEVATKLGVHPVTVRRYVKQGQLPAIRIGRKIMILRAPLEKLLCPAPTHPS